MKHNKKRRRHVYRRNPFAIKNIAGNVGGNLRSGLYGAVAIAANKAIANQLYKLISGIYPIANNTTIRPLVQLGSALFIMPSLAKLTKMKALQDGVTVAAGETIFSLGRTFLPAGMQSALAGYDFPALPDYRPGSNDMGVLALQGEDGALPIPTVGF